jgi:hypothetical protein
VNIDPEHDADPHVVATGALAQLPFWHPPVFPQGGEAAHLPLASIASLTFLQLPLWSTLHLWQVGHIILTVQQRPSVQKFPGRHSESPEHGSPSGVLVPHFPISQTVGVLQSAVAEQAVLQAPPLQAYNVHS